MTSLDPTQTNTDALSHFCAVYHKIVEEDDDDSYQYVDEDEDDEKNDSMEEEDTKPAAVVVGQKLMGDDQHSTDSQSLAIIQPTIQQFPDVVVGTEDNLCALCGLENHAPLRNCKVAEPWARQQFPRNIGAQVVPQSFVQAYMNEVVKLYAQVNDDNDDFTSLRQARDDLQRRQWWAPEVFPDQQENLPQRDLPVAERIRATDANNNHRAVIALRYFDAFRKKRSATCQICFETFVCNYSRIKGLRLCRHAPQFCDTCWGTYLQQNMHQILMLQCPKPDCKVKIPEGAVETLYPAGLERYRDLFLADFARHTHPRLRPCPGPNCDCFVVQQSNRVAAFARQGYCAACNTIFCAHCGELPHPLREIVCPNQLAGDEEQVEPEPLLHRAQKQKSARPNKLCPQCKVEIEKIGGCNRMRCPCGHAFCWICLADMSDGYNHQCANYWQDTNPPRVRRRERPARPKGSLDHFMLAVQGRVDEADYEAVTRCIQEMGPFTRALTFFLNHDDGMRYAQGARTECLPHRIQNYTLETGCKPWMQTGFNASANETLVCARRVIKYAYAYAFEMSLDEGVQKADAPVAAAATAGKARSCHAKAPSDLFELHLDRLVRFTEELSGLSEYPLTSDDRTRLIDLVRKRSKECFFLLPNGFKVSPDARLLFLSRYRFSS